LLQLGRRLGAARLRSAIESALQLGCADAAAVQHLMATDGLRHQRPSLLLEVGNLLSRSEEHTSELQSLAYLVCRLMLEKKMAKCGFGATRLWPPWAQDKRPLFPLELWDTSGIQTWITAFDRPVRFRSRHRPTQ